MAVEEKSQIERDTEWLFDLLVSKPNGITYVDFKHGRPRFSQAVNRLRRALGADDQINVICEPQGQFEPWRYRLVGTLDDAGPWVTNRLDDMEARLGSMRAIASSCVAASNSRTNEGRRARLTARYLDRLAEDLEDLMVS